VGKNQIIMKKLVVLIFALPIIQLTTNAQPCLPGGITFTTQEQIDSFQINYPNCSEVEGDVSIGGGMGGIWNLNGLNVLTSIGGSFSICYNESLTSLCGMDNLEFVGGDLNIGGFVPPGLGHANDSLTSIADLVSLNSIGGDLLIADNPNLIDLTGLENLESVSGSVGIYHNTSLVNLIALENAVASITEDLMISGNSGLISLSGLEGMSSVHGTLQISSNDMLTNLTGLEGLTNIEDNLLIMGNDNLNILTGLDNMTSVGGYLRIHNNDALESLMGLHNLTSIGHADYGWSLFISENDVLTNLQGLNNLISIEGDAKIYGNDVLTSLTGLGSLAIIEGSLWIGDLYNNGQTTWITGNISLINFSGLDNLNSIGESLWVLGNDSLTSLTGLDNLTIIGDDLIIFDNPALVNLTGLNSLTNIEGKLKIGYLVVNYQVTSILGNISLVDLSALENETSIAGTLWILGNDNLKSLSGLHNIESGTFNNLSICKNDSLSMCEVESVCNYLALGYGAVEIHNNAPGCNSPEEILDSCMITIVEERNFDDYIIISPNPVSNELTISWYQPEPGYAKIEIYNSTGNRIKQLVGQIISEGEHEYFWNTNNLLPGIYFIRLETGNKIVVRKIIKH